MQYLPPELLDNYCHIAPEWEQGVGQKLWFVSAPYSGAVLRFSGEPTSILYAIAPLVDEIKRGNVPGLSLNDVALLNPIVASDKFYAELEWRLRRQSLRVICISTLTASSPEARRIAQVAKKVDPGTITVFGGPHEDDIALKTAVDPLFDGIVDFSVAGDGEYALLQLTNMILANPGTNSERIKAIALERADEFRQCEGRGGVYFRSHHKAKQIPLSGKMSNLDNLPLMPRELLLESDTKSFSIFKNRGRNIKTAQIITHRGCAWRCSFCSESASLNTRSVASVIREIEEIKHFRGQQTGCDREDYGAIFFDDSTFTTRSTRRKEFLQSLYDCLRNSGLEWGCQTRLDQIDRETLELMKDAGCTYVFTGLESASDEMLRAMIKDEGRRHIETAFEAINRVGMRVGVSLIFGVAELGSNKTRETRETILETLDFVERQTHFGNIVLVSPNIATYYPHTRMTSASGEPLNFRDPIVNLGYPWNRFEEGEGHHPQGINREMAEFIIKESIRRFGEYLVDQDVYSFEEYKEAYRTGALDRDNRVYADFNHASITNPLREAHAAANTLAGLTLSAGDRERKIEEARSVAAYIMGVPERRSENVVLARNATEAASLAFWLANLHLKRRPTTVLTTNAENISVQRAFRFYMDHGNPSGRDFWTSYQDFGVRKPKDYLIKKQPTGIKVLVIDVISDTANMEERVLRHVTKDTNLVVFSHVVRDDGRICDVERLCNSIREINPETYILVDGAQALGALPSIDVEKLGCDFYIAAPHKTLGSFSLGLLYISDRAKANMRHLPARGVDGTLRCVIMEGMFAKSLNVISTVDAELSLPEIEGFTTAVKSLERAGWITGKDCERLDQFRRKLKTLFIHELRQIPSVQITSPVDEQHSNFILTFRFVNKDNRMIVEKVWRKHLVFVSYIARTDAIRASFGPINTVKDVELALCSFRDEVNNLDVKTYEIMNKERQ